MPSRLHKRTSLFLIIMLFTICISLSVTATANPTEKHILFLAPSTPDYPAFQLYTQGVKSSLAKKPGYKSIFHDTRTGNTVRLNQKGTFHNAQGYLLFREVCPLTLKGGFQMLRAVIVDD